jgi:hypothetical protein
MFSRWEVVIDNVFFDGKQLPTPAGAIDGKISALIDTVKFPPAGRVTCT